MKKSTKVFAALAGAALVVAGGSAYTAGNTVPPSTAGSGSATVTGAVATDIEHVLSADGTKVNSTTITFEATQADNKVAAAFGTTGDLETCEVAAAVATCDWTTLDPQPATSSVANLRVAVSSK